MRAEPGFDAILECPACGGRRFERALTVADYQFNNPGTWDIDRCAECKLLFLSPMPNEATLDTFYPPVYYTFQQDEDEPPPSHVARRSIGDRILARLRRSVGDPYFPTPGRMLDIGCAAGEALDGFKSSGWDVFGVEPNPVACEAGYQRGLDIRQGAVLDADFPAAYFDYVRGNHSFEHVPNPVETLTEIRRIIKPSGRLMFSLPNVNGIVARHFGQDWIHLAAPVHTFSYQPGNLRKMLARNGFRTTHVRFTSSFLGITGSQQIREKRLTSVNGDSKKVGHTSPLAGELLARAADLIHRGDCIEITAEPI